MPDQVGGSAAKDYAFAVDLTHNQQHALVLVVTDIHGNKAVSQNICDWNQRMKEFMCSDRNNPLTVVMVLTKSGRMIQLGGNQGLGMPAKRVDNKNVFPSMVFQSDTILGAPAFDGGMGVQSEIMVNPVLKLADGKEIKSPSVNQALSSW